MGREVASRWVFGIVLYFIILAVMLAGGDEVEALQPDSTINYSGGSYGSSKDNFGACEEPRLINPYTRSCKKLMDFGSVYDSSTCNQISGCTWTNTTGFFDWFTGAEPTQSCAGNVNTTFYNDNVSLGTTTFTSGSSTSLCEMADLQDDNHLCVFMGCTFTTTDYKAVKSVTSTWGVIGDILTLNISFGFETSGINTLLNFLLIVLPFIILIFAGYILFAGG